MLFETPLNETCNICEKEQKHILPVPISLKINLMAIYVCGNKCFSKTFIATNIFNDKYIAQNIFNDKCVAQNIWYVASG